MLQELPLMPVSKAYTIGGWLGFTQWEQILEQWPKPEESINT